VRSRVLPKLQLHSPCHSGLERTFIFDNISVSLKKLLLEGVIVRIFAREELRKGHSCIDDMRLNEIVLCLI
jgi:hypothetical protein